MFKWEYCGLVWHSNKYDVADPPAIALLGFLRDSESVAPKTPGDESSNMMYKEQKMVAYIYLETVHECKGMSQTDD